MWMVRRALQKIISFVGERQHVKRLTIFTNYFFLAFFYKFSYYLTSIQLSLQFNHHYREHFMETKLEKEKLKIINKFDYSL